MLYSPVRPLATFNQVDYFLISGLPVLVNRSLSSNQYVFRHTSGAGDMWLWGHAGVGYLIYSAYTRTQHSPEALAAIFLTDDRQFPDLINKLLSYSFGLLPKEQTLGVPAVSKLSQSCRLFRLFVSLAIDTMWRCYGLENNTIFTYITQQVQCQYATGTSRPRVFHPVCIRDPA